MKKLLSVFICFCLMFAFTVTAQAAQAWSGVSVPSKIEVDTGGFMVHGNALGNEGSCSNSNNKFYVPSSHPQYQRIFAMTLAAYTAKMHIQGYITSCNSSNVAVVGSTSAVQLWIL